MLHKGGREAAFFLVDGLTTTASEHPSIDTQKLGFSIRFPITVGGGQSIQYQSVGFETPVSLRQNEKVVIGITTMGDRALIVVVTATVAARGKQTAFLRRVSGTGR